MMALLKIFKQPQLGEKDLAVFCEQFAIMLASGMTILDTLHIVEQDQKKRSLKNALKESSETVRQGHSLSEAFDQYPAVFPMLLRRMVYAGEMAGRLDKMFEGLAQYYEKQAEIRHRLLEASLYPVIILVFSFLVVFFLLQYVLPVFVNIFDQLGTEVPAITQGLLHISRILTDNWLILLSALVLGALITQLGNRDRQFCNYKDLLYLKLPFIGKLFMEAELMRLAATLAMLLKNDIGVIQGLHISREVIKNAAVQASLIQIAAAVENGKSLSDSMAAIKIYPAGFTAMVRVGEVSGKLAFSLEKAAVYYQKVTERKIQLVMRLLEPVILLFVGLIVFVIVLSVMLPVYEIYAGYSELL